MGRLLEKTNNIISSWNNVYERKANIIGTKLNDIRSLANNNSTTYFVDTIGEFTLNSLDQLVKLKNEINTDLQEFAFRCEEKKENVIEQYEKLLSISKKAEKIIFENFSFINEASDTLLRRLDDPLSNMTNKKIDKILKKIHSIKKKNDHFIDKYNKKVRIQEINANIDGVINKIGKSITNNTNYVKMINQDTATRKKGMDTAVTNLGEKNSIFITQTHEPIIASQEEELKRANHTIKKANKLVSQLNKTKRVDDHTYESILEIAKNNYKTTEKMSKLPEENVLEESITADIEKFKPILSYTETLKKKPKRKKWSTFTPAKEIELREMLKNYYANVNGPYPNPNDSSTSNLPSIQPDYKKSHYDTQQHIKQK